MKNPKNNKAKRVQSSVYPYTGRRSTSKTIYDICTNTKVSFDISKVINGQPRKA